MEDAHDFEDMSHLLGFLGQLLSVTTRPTHHHDNLIIYMTYLTLCRRREGNDEKRGENGMSFNLHVFGYSCRYLMLQQRK